MNIISVTDITKTYTERKLFEKASFYLQEREKVGVIGINRKIYSVKNCSGH